MVPVDLGIATGGGERGSSVRHRSMVARRRGHRKRATTAPVLMRPLGGDRPACRRPYAVGVTVRPEPAVRADAAAHVLARRGGRTLVLASGSPARLRLLRDAGFAPKVVVSGVDEEAVDASDTASLVLALAERKALAVARPGGGAVVVGCDSMLDVGGRRFGKPRTDEEALHWLRDLRGCSGVLYTGHCLVDEATGRSVSAVEGTTVRFAQTSEDELAAYVSTGEATAVAGAFTLDGRSAPFVDGVEGNPSNVIGLSLPLLRTLLGELGIAVYDLWSEAGRHG